MGFSRASHARLTLFSCFVDRATSWVDERNVVDIEYLDFSKDFDSILYSILVGKLLKCGINNATIRGIYS